MKIVKNLLFALFITLLLLLPDFIGTLFLPGLYNFNWYRFVREAGATFGIAFILTLSPRWFLVPIFSLFTLFAFVSITHYLYFHTFLMPYEVGILKNGDDVKDIFFSLERILPSVVSFILLWGGATYLVYKLDKLFTPVKFPKISIPLFLVALVIYPYFIHKKPNIYLANFTHFSYFNTLNTLYLALLKNFHSHRLHNYKPYIVEKVGGGKKIVVVIMGESLNFKRMHLFGWEVNNTPNLDKLKNDPHFFYKPAISSSVRTICSVTTFFYLKREPDNIAPLVHNWSNLMKLADENGYDTYWLSMQSDVSLISKIITFAHHKKFEWEFPKQYDGELLEELKKIPFTQKTFLVIHLKAVHSPYNRYVPPSFRKFSGKRGAYYNGVLYNDYVISKIIDYIRTHARGEYAIYFTSDHGEMLGFPEEGGRYGHSQLVWGDTFVPFLYYSDNPRELNRTIYNHYQIGKMVAEDLGYKIINPNENGTFFVNGVQIDGSAGFIHYKFETNCSTPLKNPEKCLKLLKKVKY